VQHAVEQPDAADGRGASHERPQLIRVLGELLEERERSQNGDEEDEGKTPEESTYKRTR
jgi:hypothetical protein